MNRYSAASEAKLTTCRFGLQQVFRRVLEGWDHTILVGHRGQTAQDQAFQSGASTKRWPESKHNRIPSDAVDVAPWPIDWSDTERFRRFGSYALGVAAGMGIPLRWGGDWDGDKDVSDQTFNDLVHFELR